ncbi:endonuclease type 7 [Pseudomonas phage phiPto-bp6g]|nr:endonuclease type 7 [Pseudomonas phage phiPto-bp6g]
MTLSDAIAKVTDAARDLGYGSLEIRELIPDVRDMLYNLDTDLTDEVVDKYIEVYL